MWMLTLTRDDRDLLGSQPVSTYDKMMRLHDTNWPSFTKTSHTSIAGLFGIYSNYSVYVVGTWEFVLVCSSQRSHMCS